MNSLRLRSFIWIPSYAIGKCLEIPRSKLSILSLFFFRNPIGHCKTGLLKDFDAQTYMLCQCQNEGCKTSYDFKRMRKTRFVPNTLVFVFFYNEKYVKSAPAAEGGGGEIKFSAEIMVNRATWQIVECISFLH